MEEVQKVRFRDVSWPIKVAVVVGWVMVISWALALIGLVGTIVGGIE